MSATKQQIRQIIADNNLSSAADVYSLRLLFVALYDLLAYLPLF